MVAISFPTVAAGGGSFATPLGTPARASSPEATGHPALVVRGHYCTVDQEVYLDRPDRRLAGGAGGSHKKALLAAAGRHHGTHCPQGAGVSRREVRRPGDQQV